LVACHFASSYKYSVGHLSAGDAVTVAGVLAKTKGLLIDFALYKCDLYSVGNSHGPPTVPSSK
jgi:hypothetical protein